MLIYNPLHATVLTQGFGENKACINSSGHVVGKSGATCPAGYQDLYKSMGMSGHNGLDHASYLGEPIYFPVISETSWTVKNHVDSAGGIGTDILANSPIYLPNLPSQAGREAKRLFLDNDKMLVKFRFWHAEKNMLPDGTQIGVGDYAKLIQKSDSSGASSGHHLHWSMKFIDSNGDTLDKNNGYYGAVDFTELKGVWQDKSILGLFGRKEDLTGKQQIERAILTLRSKKNYYGAWLLKIIKGIAFP